MITRNPLSVHNDDRRWQQELAEAFRSPTSLLEYLEINPDQLVDPVAPKTDFPMLVPRPFADLMAKGDATDPLLKQVLPLQREMESVEGYIADPLAEHQGPAPGLLHKYQSRALLMLKNGCAVNCRYCFRRHYPYQEQSINQQWQHVLTYLNSDRNINELVLSGGDPLMARDSHLEALFNRLLDVPHLRRIRIHSRLPVVLPSRITDGLIALLEQAPWQILLVTHINHGNELSPALVSGLQRLKQAGVTLLNQSVLLQGVNDDASVLAELSERLFQAGVLPYYLHLLDPVQGAAHFDVGDEIAREIMARLLAKLPGYLVPRLVRELPGQSSKTLIDLKLA